ncbi:polysaccharide biosynthesis/export family protein [Marinibacterium profundimaris]|uniref:Uncharacterized protein n=1 Tax=Marinibacterium profundimaris TaxID=1679460 RepID=A0A225NSS2_9RHOB|nr:polysaccharide biosynthesis/export family protein [Marinibacterium profundimaris]OWU77370.1 hypothetical protein ATO3_01235 [Marinibacterium profundimaris]
MIKWFALPATVCLGLSACGGGGPTTEAIVAGAGQVIGSRAAGTPDPAASYVLVEVDRSIAQSVTRATRDLQARAFHDVGGPERVAIGRGDVVQISIVSSSETGYVDFTTASLSPINQTSLVPQQVGRDGELRVPPLGLVRAAGMTVDEFEQALTEQLQTVLVDPAAIVEIVDRQSAKVAVVGKVEVPGRISIDDANLRLLDMITAAGGPTDRSEDLRVRLSRRGVTRTALLEDVLGAPGLNVYVRPGDVIEVETPENRVTILGAGGRSNETLLLNRPDDTLVDVLGGAGGLANRTADRTGVFLYRDTPAPAMAALGVDARGYPGPTVPTVFRFDLSTPESFFAAKSFEVADGDILYLAASFRDAVEAFSTFVPLPQTYVSDLTISSP